jgi:hypothetical protein
MIIALDGQEQKHIRSVIVELRKRGKVIFGKPSFATKK